jgi:secondary thiamine-phosphate synthase enzyme
MIWIQREVSLPRFARGLHLITSRVVEAMPELSEVDVGLLHVFIQHTSAGLTINENADRDVPADLETALDRLAPEDFPYRHTCEGKDDMPAHIKSALLDTSLAVPVRAGRLALGTWQGIFLCEHRDRGTPRKLILTLQGAPVDRD